MKVRGNAGLSRTDEPEPTCTVRADQLMADAKQRQRAGTIPVLQRRLPELQCEAQASGAQT